MGGSYFSAWKSARIARARHAWARFEPAFTDRTYTIEWSTDLVNWSTLGSPLTGISGTYDFTDTSAGRPWKFYRVKIFKP